MENRYFMSRARARAVRLFAVLCFLLAGMGAWTLPTMLVGPEWLAFSIDCEKQCHFQPEPLDQLSGEVRHIVANVANAENRMTAAMADGYWWWRLLGIEVLNAVPFAFLFFSVGMALWRFGDRQEHRDWNGIRWLQWATVAGVALSLADPLAQILRDALFLAAVTDNDDYSFSFDFVAIVNHLFFAGAAWAAIWALAAGLRARGDLAEIV